MHCIDWKCADKHQVNEMFTSTIQSESSQKWYLYQNMLQIIQLYCKNLRLE